MLFFRLAIAGLILNGALAFAQSESVKLAWIQIPNATKYEIEIASSENRLRPLLTRTATISEVTVQVPPGSYVYRVRVVSANGSKGPWSDASGFEVKPPQIILTSPANGSTFEFSSQSLRFQWNGARAYKYKIQIVDGNGGVAEHETSEPFFVWHHALGAGVYRWRVAYAEMPANSWSDYRTIQLQAAPIPVPIGETKSLDLERSNKSVWGGNVYGGASITFFKGDYAATNVVNASALSGEVTAQLVRHPEHSSANPDYREWLGIELREQSLVKENESLPGFSLGLARFWPAGSMKLGVFLEGGYRQWGLFIADPNNNYKFDTFWRDELKAGACAEILMGEHASLDPFVSIGAVSSASSKLAPDGVQADTEFEAGLNTRFGVRLNWGIRLKYQKQQAKWSTSSGTSSLASEDWALDLGWNF